MRRKGLKAYGGAVADLRPRHGQIIVGGSNHPRSPRVAARPQSNADLSTYTGRLGAAVRKRREELGLSVDDLSASLAAAGIEATKHSVYHWEKGLRPIPVNALPALAKTLKLAIRELVPAK